MDQGKRDGSLVDDFVAACGLPAVRGAASVRRALWHLRKVDAEPTHDDLQAILPQLRLTLTSYLPASQVDECIARGARFLGIEEIPSAAIESLRDVRVALRKANQHLRKSTELKLRESDE
jgi:hypothetical protein